LLAHADEMTIITILSQMEAPSAANLVMAMDTERAVGLLTRAHPDKVADVLRNITPTRRRALTDRLPKSD
jgi:flagellar motility protein MotE (MotC chaperone)